MLNLVAQLVVADKIIFDPEKHAHTLHHIRNEIAITTIPSIIVHDLLVKLLFSDDQSLVNVNIQVENSDNEVLFFRELQGLENKRSQSMRPGVDISFQFRFLVEIEGTYNILLIYEGNEICSYPIYVRLIDKLAGVKC